MRRKWGTTIILLAVGYLLINGNRGLWRLYQLHREKKELRSEVARLRSDINHYQIEYKAFGRDLLAVEKSAREELNLVKPGEMVYKFTPPGR